MVPHKATYNYRRLLILLLLLIFTLFDFEEMVASQRTTLDNNHSCTADGCCNSAPDVLDRLIEECKQLKQIIDTLKVDAERRAKQTEDLRKDLNNAISTRTFVTNTDRSPTSERLTTTTTEKPTTSREGCPTGFTLFNKSTGCYKIISRRLNFEDAYRQCTLEHPVGRSAVVESEQEHKSIQEYLLSNKDYDAPCKEGFWLALKRKIKNGCQSRAFVWRRRNGTTTYEEDLTYEGGWGEGEPNCLGGTQSDPEDCGHYYRQLNFNWNDTPCGPEMCVLCEAPPLSRGEGIFPF